jgi:thiol-disulfide isomerase/thioredoxin
MWALLQVRSALTMVIMLLLMGVSASYSATLPTVHAGLRKLYSHYSASATGLRDDQLPMAETTTTDATRSNPEVIGGNFTLPVVGPEGFTGSKLTLSDFQGNITVLWFMQPSCPYCREMEPIMSKLYRQYAEKGVVFIAISGRAPRWTTLASDIAGFIRGTNSPLIYVYDSTGEVLRTWVTGYPTTFTLSRSGTVSNSYVGLTSYDIIAQAINFTITPPIFQEFSSVFRIDSPLHARVDSTITVHPFRVLDNLWAISNSTEWNPGLGGAGISNISARDYKTNQSLLVTPREASSDGKLHIYFANPRGDGYRFVLSLDLDSPYLGYSATDNVYWLKWAWSVVGGIEAIPQQVTVVLPLNFNLKDITIRQNDTVRPVQRTNYTTSLQGGRLSVSFSAPIRQNSLVEWTVRYTPSASNTTTVSSKISQSTSETTATTSGFQMWSISPLIFGLALAMIAVVAGWWIIRRQQRKR